MSEFRYTLDGSIPTKDSKLLTSGGAPVRQKSEKIAVIGLIDAEHDYSDPVELEDDNGFYSILPEVTGLGELPWPVVPNRLAIAPNGVGIGCGIDEGFRYFTTSDGLGTINRDLKNTEALNYLKSANPTNYKYLGNKFIFYDKNNTGESNIEILWMNYETIMGAANNAMWGKTYPGRPNTRAGSIAELLDVQYCPSLEMYVAWIVRDVDNLIATSTDLSTWNSWYITGKILGISCSENYIGILKETEISGQGYSYDLILSKDGISAEKTIHVYKFIGSTNKDRLSYVTLTGIPSTGNIFEVAWREKYTGVDDEIYFKVHRVYADKGMSEERVSLGGVGSILSHPENYAWDFNGTYVSVLEYNSSFNVIFDFYYGDDEDFGAQIIDLTAYGLSYLVNSLTIWQHSYFIQYDLGDNFLMALLYEPPFPLYQRLRVLTPPPPPTPEEVPIDYGLEVIASSLEIYNRSNMPIIVYMYIDNRYPPIDPEIFPTPTPVDHMIYMSCPSDDSVTYGGVGMHGAIKAIAYSERDGKKGPVITYTWNEV